MTYLRLLDMCEATAQRAAMYATGQRRPHNPYGARSAASQLLAMVIYERDGTRDPWLARAQQDLEYALAILDPYCPPV